jgi:hypothetical protein
MEPTAKERLARIREVTDEGLHYFATAYLKTNVAEAHRITQRDLLMAYMTEYANIVALLDDVDLGERAMMRARREVVSRYLKAAGDHPWVAPGSI